MADREKVIKAIETHLSTDISVGCDDCTYENDGWCTTRVLADALALLKEQEEREKAICKGICDFIRGSCSTDTYEDKEYVCHVIQQMFIKGRSVKQMDREKVIKSIKACAHHPDHDCQSCDYCGDNFLCFNDQLIEDFETLLKEQEAVVRCKDCKHGRLYAPNCVDCEHIKMAIDADWFCADGERRTDDA